MKYVFGIIIATFFLISIFAGNYFVSVKNFILELISGNSDFVEINELRIENESLKARLENSCSLLNLEAKDDLTYKTAKIFSTYPFNNRNSFAINLGSNNGIQPKMAVLAGEGVLLGQISEVFKNYSLVKSIFDPNFKIPVRIGSNEINALFEGGNTAMVTMIDKKSIIAIGDSVYTSSSDFFYGLRIGEIAEIFDQDEKNIFKKSVIKIGYNFNDLREVLVLNFDLKVN